LISTDLAFRHSTYHCGTDTFAQVSIKLLHLADEANTNRDSDKLL